MYCQIEVNPYTSNYKLVELCQSLGIVVTAYSPFANPGRPWRGTAEPDIFDEPQLSEVAKKYNKTKAQVCIIFDGYFTLQEILKKYLLIGYG